MVLSSTNLNKKEGFEDNLSLEALSCVLSISTATAKNWVKLGKLVPTISDGNSLYFAREYVEALKKSIENGENFSLKSRRNKKYVSGCGVYNSYVSSNSKNLYVVNSLVDEIHSLRIDVDEDLLSLLIADCALKFLFSYQKVECSKDILLSYIDGNVSKNEFSFLIDDLITDKKLIRDSVIKYPDLFKSEYLYEKGEDIIGLLYISLRNIGARKLTGAYYTPTKVVQKLCDNLFSKNDYNNKTVLDPCCGTGNFIINLPSEIPYKNVFASDVDELAIKIARINYALKYGISDKTLIYDHIKQVDFIKSADKDVKFDFIIGNPPWGFSFSQDLKAFLRKNYQSAVGNNIESYDIFVEQAIKILKKYGVLAFVLPEAILNVSAHNAIRKFILECSSIQRVDFLGDTFDKVQCPSIILQLMHNQKHLNTVGTVVSDANRSFTIGTDRKFEDVFLLNIDDFEYSILQKITNISSQVTLRDNAVFALGIVTGDNKKYVSSVKTFENEMILKGSDIYKFKFKPSNNFIEFKPELFQQVAPVEYYRAKEKLLYRFICNQPVFAYDNSGVLSLNSCNILIPNIQGLDIKYIMAVLNSRVVSFYLMKKFNSVKLLRAHLEQVPIPKVRGDVQGEIIELVNSIIEQEKPSDIEYLYNILDEKIAHLYELSDKDYDFIKASLINTRKYLF